MCFIDRALLQVESFARGRLLSLPKKLAAHLMIRDLVREKRTMVSLRRLWHLYDVCSDSALPGGAFVECGVAKGGCVALMSLLSGGKRTVWGFDSFEEMPQLTTEDEGSGQDWVGYRCSGPSGLREAETTLSRFHVDGDWVELVPGWFEETLAPTLPRIGTIAVLRLDNDWYKSTKYCLETLYDNVVRGGTIIIDDYHTFVGFKRAVDETRKARNIESPLITTEEQSEAFWQKQ
jgi:Macrocin-O-methyltransferase (TylF)